MDIKKITWSAALLALVTALAVPPGPAQAAPAPGNTDFNGDGYNDLAFGSPNYPGYPGSNTSGLTVVLYGGPDGIGNEKHITRPAPDCKILHSPCMGWGLSLAAADIDADGRTDLISRGYDDMRVDSWTSQGVTTIERRTSTNVNLIGGQFDDQPGADIVGTLKNGNYWLRIGGWYNRDAKATFHVLDEKSYIHAHESSLAAGDVDGDGKLETAIVSYRYSGEGEPGYHLWLVDDPHLAPVKFTALASPSTCTSSPTPGRDCAKPGSRVAMGNVNGDGHSDLVMLTPETATLQVWYGSSTGLSPARTHTADLSHLTPGTELGPGLAVGDVNGDGSAEIAVGASKAGVSGHGEAGAVAVIPGSLDGPVVKHAQIITQDGIGPVGGPTPAPDPIGEGSQPGDHFGQAIKIIDITGDGKGEVVVGAPAKHGGAGMVAVLRGSATGVSTTTAQTRSLHRYGLNSTLAAFGAVMLK